MKKGEFHPPCYFASLELGEDPTQRIKRFFHTIFLFTSTSLGIQPNGGQEITDRNCIEFKMYRRGISSKLDF